MQTFKKTILSFLVVTGISNFNLNSMIVNGHLKGTGIPKELVVNAGFKILPNSGYRVIENEPYDTTNIPVELIIKIPSTMGYEPQEIVRFDGKFVNICDILKGIINYVQNKINYRLAILEKKTNTARELIRGDIERSYCIDLVKLTRDTKVCFKLFIILKAILIEKSNTAAGIGAEFRNRFNYINRLAKSEKKLKTRIDTAENAIREIFIFQRILIETGEEDLHCLNEL